MGMTTAASLWDLERAGSSPVTLIWPQERCHSLGSPGCRFSSDPHSPLGLGGAIRWSLSPAAEGSGGGGCWGEQLSGSAEPKSQQARRSGQPYQGVPGT